MSATTASGAKCARAPRSRRRCSRGRARSARRRAAAAARRRAGARVASSAAIAAGQPRERAAGADQQPARGQVAAARDGLATGRRVEVRQASRVTLHGGDRRDARSASAAAISSRRRGQRRRQRTGRSSSASSSATCRRSRTCRGRPRRCACCAAGARSRSRAISGLPSVTECTSVVAPPTSMTTRSPTSSASSSAAISTAPGVGRIAPVTTSPMRSMPGRVGDVLLERVVDHGARRHDVELVDAGVDVAGEPHAEARRARAARAPRRRPPSCRRTRRSAAPRARARRPALSSTVSQSPPSTPPASRIRFGAICVDRAQVGVAQSAGGLVLDDAAGAERRLARGHRGHLRCVRPCTVMRRPPAAEEVASVSAGSSGPVAASSCARAASTPMRTSPCGDRRRRDPLRRAAAASPSGPARASPSNALTTVVVEPISATSASMRRPGSARHAASHPPLAHRRAR